MKRKFIVLPALCLASLSAHAQFVTSGGNTTTNDNVGIGTSTPTFKLEVGGTADINQRTIGINTMPAVYVPDQLLYNHSIAIGNGLRQLSPQPNISYGDRNTSVGIGTMVNATIAQDNVAVGTSALAMTTGGDGNVAVGVHALFASTGHHNVGVGHIALAQTTTGGSNIGLGYSALSSNLTGNSNIGIGFGSLGGNTAGSNNIGIGSLTRTIGPNAANLTNAIAIGANALIGKSNAISLGDTTKPTLVGIGTAYPDYQLDVRATANPVRLRGLQSGSTSDYVVTADANGVLRQIPVSSIGGATAGQGLTLSGTDLDLGDECGKGGGAFKNDREINMNNYDLRFNSAEKGKLYMGMHTDCEKPLMTRLEISIKGITAVNDYDVNLPSTSGLRFTDLTAKHDPVTNKYDGVLSLDEDGDVIWVKACCTAGKDAAEYEELKNTVDELKAELAMLKTLLKQGQPVGQQGQLYQNVPNPGGASTKIGYALGSQSREAFIAIYDMNGRVMNRIPLQRGAGNSSVTVDMSSWAAGTYSYTLFVDGEFRDTKKMQVVH